MLRVFGGIVVGAALTALALERIDRAFRTMPRPEDFRRPQNTVAPRDGETLAAYTMRREAVIGAGTDVWSDAARDWIPEVNKEKPLDGENLDSFRTRSPSNCWFAGQGTPGRFVWSEASQGWQEPAE